MESTYRESSAAVVADASPADRAHVRCSIILPPSAEPRELETYLSGLRRQRTWGDCEVILPLRESDGEYVRLKSMLPTVRMRYAGDRDHPAAFDTSATAAAGEYLLFMRELAAFDPAALDASIKDLEHSGIPVSISESGRFVLVQRALYRSCGGFDALLAAFNRAQQTPATASPATRPENASAALSAGRNTVIDPSVTTDSPGRVVIGDDCVIRRGVILRPEGGEIVIGDHCTIDDYTVLQGPGEICIGDWTLLESHCILHALAPAWDRFDVPLIKQTGRGRGIYLMGDNRIGANAVICDDVTIGKGTVVSPGSVVTESLPMACIAAGAPAGPTAKRHQGGWETHKQERAAAEGMPEAVHRHVMARASLIAQWVEPGDCVLDVGCGEGLITTLLVEKAARVVGCDYSKEAVQVARERCPGAEFVCCNSTSLPFADASFSKVTLSDVAEHLMPGQFIQTIENIHRVLRPGGALVLATPLTGRGAKTAHYAHIYEYSLVEMERILGRYLCDLRHVNSEFGLVIGRKGRVPTGTWEGDGVCRQQGAGAPSIRMQV